MSRGRQIALGIGRWVALLFALVIAVAECGLRLFGPHIQFPTVCHWDPRVGCLLEPNLSVDFGLGAPFHVTTNSEGRRDRPRENKAKGVRRIEVLGDSVAFGVPVGDDQTLAARMEERLAGASVQVVNAGSPYLRGTEQQLSYFVDTAKSVAPDLVLLVFTAQNDFFDNAHHYFWRRGVAGLERVPHASPPTLKHRVVIAASSTSLIRWLSVHSYAFGLFELAFWNITHYPRLTDYSDWGPATEDVVVRLQAEARAAGATLVILLVPTPRAVELVRRREPPSKDQDEARITDIAARHGIVLWDPTLLLAAAPADAPLQLEDGHFTARGNDAIAEALAARVPSWLAAGQPVP